MLLGKSTDAVRSMIRRDKLPARPLISRRMACKRLFMPETFTVSRALDFLS